MTRVACERIGASAAHAAGFRGEGQMIAVCDTGLDLGSVDDPHPSLGGTVVEAFSYRRGGAWDDPHGHGTHVIGCILGSGTAPDGEWTGSAPGAALFLQSVYGTIVNPFECRPAEVTEMLRNAYARGARIHSNSWDEASSRGVYSRAAREIDNVTVEHPDLLVVVAVGNSGVYASPESEPTPSTLRSPSPAKNALAVGATKNQRPEHSRPYRNFYDRRARRSIPPAILAEGWSLGPDGVAPFSGRGPTRDGRIKPDLVAPGTAVLSARSRHRSNIFPTLWGDLDDPLHALMGGTSVAAPLVSGSAAVARQYLVAAGEGAAPSSALLRAVLVNGAAPLHGALVPNSNQGWGRLDLEASLALAPGLTLLTLEEDVTIGEEFRVVFPLRRSGDTVRVTLAWTDPPGPELESDLDLIVRVSGEEWHGNQPPGAETFDRTNNVERVVVEHAQREVEIVVRGERMDVGRQAFALAITGAFPAPIPAGGEVAEVDGGGPEPGRTHRRGPGRPLPSPRPKPVRPRSGGTPTHPSAAGRSGAPWRGTPLPIDLPLQRPPTLEDLQDDDHQCDDEQDMDEVPRHRSGKPQEPEDQ